MKLKNIIDLGYFFLKILRSWTSKLKQINKKEYIIKEEFKNLNNPMMKNHKKFRNPLNAVKLFNNFLKVKKNRQNTIK